MEYSICEKEKIKELVKNLNGAMNEYIVTLASQSSSSSEILDAKVTAICSLFDSLKRNTTLPIKRKEKTIDKSGMQIEQQMLLKEEVLKIFKEFEIDLSAFPFFTVSLSLLRATFSHSSLVSITDINGQARRAFTDLHAEIQEQNPPLDLDEMKEILLNANSSLFTKRCAVCERHFNSTGQLPSLFSHQHKQCS